VISVVGVSVLGGPQWANIDYIRLRLQSLVDTDDAGDSMFVDFVGC